MICCGNEMEIHQMIPRELGTAELCPQCGKSYFARKFWVLIDSIWVIAESQAPTSRER